MALRWEDSEDIAIALAAAHPGVDPLTVRFTELHAWVTQLEGFQDRSEERRVGKECRL